MLHIYLYITYSLSPCRTDQANPSTHRQCHNCMSHLQTAAARVDLQASQTHCGLASSPHSCHCTSLSQSHQTCSTLMCVYAEMSAVSIESTWAAQGGGHLGGFLQTHVQGQHMHCLRANAALHAVNVRRDSCSVCKQGVTISAGAHRSVSKQGMDKQQQACHPTTTSA
jgi:hypothetical protein